MNELTQEKIAHLQTRLQLFQTQQQLLGVLANQAQLELKALQEANKPDEPPV